MKPEIQSEQKISDLYTEKSITLEPSHGWPKKAVHYFDRKQAIAILAAKAIKRPLLVRGEPGCGKTQLARAAAQVLKMPLAWMVVNERTETEDLFWRYDALSRLSDANSPSGLKDEKSYLSAGPLWWALDPISAEAYAGSQSSKPYMAEESESKRDFSNGVLLLIDEIDKADRSVPNSLLEALGNYSFDVPYINKRIESQNQHVSPLIVITTNGEQALPPAFMRRCLVLDLKLDDSSESAFVDQLTARGQALISTGFDNPEIYKEVAEQLWSKRQEAQKSGLEGLPGQAEYLDHLEAVLAMKACAPNMTEAALTEELAEITYKKHSI